MDALPETQAVLEETLQEESSWEVGSEDSFCDSSEESADEDSGDEEVPIRRRKCATLP